MVNRSRLNWSSVFRGKRRDSFLGRVEHSEDLVHPGQFEHADYGAACSAKHQVAILPGCFETGHKRSESAGIYKRYCFHVEHDESMSVTHIVNQLMFEPGG